ncbi:MAG: OmpW family outer membrane protein [Chitinophagaceae bacterium]
MKTYQAIIFLVMGIAGAITTNAQEAGEVRVNLNYAVGIPAGSFSSDAVNKTSYRGWTGNILYGINDKISVGLGLGYQDFYQKYPRNVYKLSDGSDVSGVLSNSIQTVPVLASVQYNFLPHHAIQPYAGVGVGGNLIMFRQYIGEFESSRNSIGFAVRPEAGINIPVSPRFGFNVNGMYNYMPYNKDGINNLSSWGVGAGIRFSLQ